MTLRHIHLFQAAAVLRKVVHGWNRAMVLSQVTAIRLAILARISRERHTHLA